MVGQPAHAEDGDHATKHLHYLLFVFPAFPLVGGGLPDILASPKDPAHLYEAAAHHEEGHQVGQHKVGQIVVEVNPAVPLGTVRPDNNAHFNSLFNPEH